MSLDWAKGFDLLLQASSFKVIYTVSISCKQDRRKSNQGLRFMVLTVEHYYFVYFVSTWYLNNSSLKSHTHVVFESSW